MLAVQSPCNCREVTHNAELAHHSSAVDSGGPQRRDGHKTVGPAAHTMVERVVMSKGVHRGSRCEGAAARWISRVGGTGQIATNVTKSLQLTTSDQGMHSGTTQFIL